MLNLLDAAAPPHPSTIAPGAHRHLPQGSRPTCRYQPPAPSLVEGGWINLRVILDAAKDRTCGRVRDGLAAWVRWTRMSRSQLIQLSRGFTLGCQARVTISLAVASRVRDPAGLGRNNTWCWMSEMGSGQ